MSKIRGRVIKHYNGFYYVDIGAGELLTCKVKGRMKQERFSLWAGDFVQLEIDSEHGMIEAVLPRTNYLLKPAVANLELIVLTFAVVEPAFSFLLTDKLLAMAEYAGITPVLCLNKIDLAEEADVEKLRLVYTAVGYKVLPVSAVTKVGVEALRKEIAGKVTALSGPSGAGKSSLLNVLDSSLHRVTGTVSAKIGRGRHTTRFAHFVPFAGGYLVDTPGFGNVFLTEMTIEKLKDTFREFLGFAGACRFTGCTHLHEPDCAVKRAVQDSLIAESRYHSYLMMTAELKEQAERGSRK